MISKHNFTQIASIPSNGFYLQQNLYNNEHHSIFTLFQILQNKLRKDLQKSRDEYQLQPQFNEDDDQPYDSEEEEEDYYDEDDCYYYEKSAAAPQSDRPRLA